MCSTDLFSTFIKVHPVRPLQALALFLSVSRAHSCPARSVVRQMEKPIESPMENLINKKTKEKRRELFYSNQARERDREKRAKRQRTQKSNQGCSRPLRYSIILPASAKYSMNDAFHCDLILFLFCSFAFALLLYSLSSVDARRRRLRRE